MKSSVAGFWAGVLATGPMTYVMIKMFETLPREEKSPLPPATLSFQLTPLSSRLWRREQASLALLSHFLYGGSTGIFYAKLRPHLACGPRVSGVVFGLSLWAVSYLGWIPSLGLRAAAQRMPPSRNFLMVLAHLLWGLSLGYAEERLRADGERMFAGELKAPAAE
ncbi:MAG: DUF6789 family protein [Bdellovibrionales bacterium]